MDRIRYIDGLRAVAVLLVVAHHVMLHSPALRVPVPFFSLAHLLLEGSHGVDLFFVLSGFCLSYPVLQRLRTQDAARLNVTRYFAKRLVRIVPPYYAAIGVLLVLPVMHGAATLADVAKQALFLDWHTAFLNGSFWTLCVEFRWYSFFPLALLLWVRAPRAFWFIACSSALLYGMTRMHAPDIGTLLPFMLGIVAADLHVRNYPVRRIALALLPLALLLALLYEPSASMPSPDGIDSPIFFVQINPGWQLAAFAFVLLAGSARPLRSVLSFAPLAAVGTASYSIYLVHEPIVTVIQSRVHLPLPDTAILAYGAALGAGFGFWAVFERVWMAGAVKERAVAAIEPLVARAARVFGIPHEVALCDAATLTRIATLEPEGEAAPV